MEFKNRFRILKGGKISLVVSALVLGSSLYAAGAPDTNVTVNSGNPTFNLSSGSILTMNGNVSNLKTAIYMYEDPTFAGTITIDGNISVTNGGALNSSSGIMASGGNVENSNITNSGNITVSSAGISRGIFTTYSTNVITTNNGTIDVNGTVAADGLKTGGLNASSITNSGTINTVSNGTANGIYDFGIANASTITNSGTLTVNALNKGIGIFVKQDVTDSIITNSGDINVILTNNGSGSSATGIDVTNLKGTSTIINTSTGKVLVQGSGEDDLVGINVNVVAVGAQPNTSIVNEGLIDITGSANVNSMHGIINYSETKIINSGTITVHHTDGSIGLASNAIYSYGDVTNSGVIQGSIRLNNANLNNNETGNISMENDLYVYIGNVTNNGTISLGRSNNNDIIGGDFTQSSTGTLQIKLMSDDNLANTTFSKLNIVNGTVTLADNTTLDVDVKTATANQSLLVDQNLSGVISSNINDIVVNIDKLNITDNSALLNFEAYLETTKILSLHVVDGMSISDAVGNNPQTEDVARVLDAINGSDVDLDAFISYLGTLSTTQEVAQAVRSVVPASTLSSLSANLLGSMSGILQARQGSLRGAGSGDIAFSDKNVWIKPFGGYTKQDDVKGINGFSANTFGLGFGIDAEYRAGQRAGLAFFYTKSNVDTNGVDQSSDVNVFNLMAYGSNPIIDDKTSLYYQIGYGIQKTDTSRYITGVNKTASADFNAKNFFVQLKAARDMQINDSFIATPALVTSYSYYKNPSYTESGAGGLNLSVDSFTAESYIIGIESEFNYSVDKDTKILSSIALSYDFGDGAQTVNSVFAGGGTSFSTKGIENDSLIYKAGVGMEKQLRNNLYFNIKYGLDGRGSNFLNHVVSAKFNYKF